jgi:hypothetical protein
MSYENFVNDMKVLRTRKFWSNKLGRTILSAYAQLRILTSLTPAEAMAEILQTFDEGMIEAGLARELMELKAS